MAELYLPEHRHICIFIEEVYQYPGSIHDMIRNKMAYVYAQVSDGTLGWQLETEEHVDNLNDFLLFVEFVFYEEDSVPLIYRAHDLYTIGHLDQHRHAYLLNQDREDQLERTMDCLYLHGITYTLMEELSDSYPDMEVAAQIRRADLQIGRQGLEVALMNLLVEDPLANIRDTAGSYLFMALFVCEGMRILQIRVGIVNTFAGVGMPINEMLLQYLYGWAAASYILAAYFNGDVGPNSYNVIADLGRTMSVDEMFVTYPLIKHALQPREFDTNIMVLYQNTVHHFYRRMGVYP